MNLTLFSSRTLESLQELGSGLFTGTTVKALNVQTVKDDPLFVGTDCPHRSYRDTKDYKDFDRQLRTERRKLQTKFGQKIEIGEFFDTTSSRYCNGKRLPFHNGSYLFESEYLRIEDLRVRQFQLKYQYPDSHVFRIGPLLDEIVPDLVSPKKLIVYSAHDTTLGVLAAYFKVKDFKWPGYASNLVIEVWDEKKIRVLFQGRVVREMHLGDLIYGMKLDIQRAANCSL